MDIKKKLGEIIPPNDYTHRHSFYNHRLVDELNDNEKKEIENALIEKLHTVPNDILIVETLAYMNSKKAMPALKNSLKNCKNQVHKIIVAISIYEIDKDNEMIEIAIDIFKDVREKWSLINAFPYLKRFNDNRIKEMLKKYVDHPDFLVSYNAKRALEMIKDA